MGKRESEREREIEREREGEREGGSNCLPNIRLFRWNQLSLIIIQKISKQIYSTVPNY